MASHTNALSLRLLNTAKTFITKITANPTANRTVSVPDRDGVVVLTNSNNTVTHGNEAIAIGALNVSSGLGSVAIGYNNVVSSDSFLIGAFGLGTINHRAVISSPNVSNIKGASQTGITNLSFRTTDNTVQKLRTNSASPTALNQLTLQNNSAIAFDGLIVARQQASGGMKCAYWEVSGLITREGNAATTTLRYSEVRAKYNPDNLTVALSADTTNGCLAISVTGLAATNLIWVASIRSAETLYA